MSGIDDPLSQALAWLREGKTVALATVVGTWGSSPRQPGSMLVVADDGSFTGSVSGGCVEAAVVDEALQVMADGRPKLLDFGITDDRAWEVGLSCGGELRVFVEKAPSSDILHSLVTTRPVARVVNLEDGTQTLVSPQSVDGILDLDADFVEAARKALADDCSRKLAREDHSLFVAVFNAPLRVIVVGAVHIAQSLAPLASLAGFEVTVIDPRQSFASNERFPDITVRTDWPDAALAGLAPDARTAVVTLTHDPKLDDPALVAALNSDAFYVGALGSRKTHGKRLARLKARDISDQQLARIHGPVGLDLGGRKPSEIAVSILAQIVAARYGRETGR